MKQLISIGIVMAFLMACNSAKEEKKEVFKKPVIEKVLEYYPNGLKRMEGQKRDGKNHGKWIYYYENGFKWSEGFFIDGLRSGSSIIYYENGKLKLEGQYKKGIKVGDWKVYTEDGKFLEKINVDKMLTRKDSIALELIPTP